MVDYLIYSVEDDINISSIINSTLSKQGYDIRSFYNATDFLKAFKEKKPNMILLDMMLPDISGENLIKEIRSDKKNNDIEIIVISANCLLMDIVSSLDLGADDYIEKPFNILELMSRVNAKVRRYQKSQTIYISDIEINLQNYEVIIDGEKVMLTSKEFEILAYLVKNKQKVVTREELLNKIWGLNMDVETRTIDMHIKSLRQKISKHNKNIIKTVYGIGYKITQ